MCYSFLFQGRRAIEVTSSTSLFHFRARVKKNLTDVFNTLSRYNQNLLNQASYHASFS